MITLYHSSTQAWHISPPFLGTWPAEIMKCLRQTQRSDRVGAGLSVLSSHQSSALKEPFQGWTHSRRPWSR